MTPRDRRAMLAAAGVGALVLVAMAVTRESPQTTPGPGAPARTAAQNARSRQVTLTDVRLELLRRPPPDVERQDSGRNPFRFAAREAAPPTPPDDTPTRLNGPGPGAMATARGAPPGPSGPPPIPLKFIGLVEAPSQAGRVAILSDGRGNVFYGKEGDTIEGRYRMVAVGTDLVELTYLDGQGRQTIRLSGQ